MSSPKPPEDARQRALAYFQAGNFERCLEAIDALPLRDDEAATLVLKGRALIELDRPEEAIEVLRGAAQHAPEDVDAWHQLGLAHLSGGDPRDAVSALRKVLGLEPRHLAALIDLAHLLFTLGEQKEAIENLEAARELSAGDLAILRDLAQMYAAAGRGQAALRANLEILDLQPRDLLAHCDAAWLCLELERLEDASMLFRELCKLDPEHELYGIHGLATVEIRRREWRSALTLAIEATRLDRFELTTAMLEFISSKLFGAVCETDEAELRARFEQEHLEHRRLHSEAVA